MCPDESSQHVIPAQAGIQHFVGSERIPACAGMTVQAVFEIFEPAKT